MTGDLLLTPEHLHVAVNHIPMIGLGASLFPLAFALIRRDRTAFFLGFLMCAVFGALVVAVMATGEAAYARFQDGPLKDLLDKAGRQAMYRHYDAAEFASIFMYVQAGLGVLGLFALWKWKRAVYPVGAATFLLAVVCIAMMVHVAAIGGRIRHPEFRPPTPIETTS